MDNVEEVRRALKALKGRIPLRQLAKSLGMSQFPLWKLLNAGSVRLNTLRRIREGLAGLDGQDANRHLQAFLRPVAADLGLSSTQKLERALRKVVVEAYRRDGRKPPRWLRERGQGRAQSSAAR
jgi:hypothetical protein